MACNLIDVLGLGYSGYVKVDDTYLLLLPSSADEQDNNLKSSGSVSTLVSESAGTTPASDRRSLKVSLSVVMTPAAAAVIAESTFQFRRSESLRNPQSLLVVIANGEGYQTAEAYCDSCSISSQDGQLCSAQLEFTAWIWEDLEGHELERVQSAFLPFNEPEHQPIPHWAACVEMGAQPGNCMGFDLNLNNNYYYGQLLEAAAGPPNPRLISAGPLDLTFTYRTLAVRGSRPAEAGSFNITFGCQPAGPVDAAPVYRYNVPFVYRDPNRTLNSYGQADGVVAWQALWYALGAMPEMDVVDE